MAEKTREIGGMAFIAAWWGIWHILAGLTIAGLWSRIPVDEKFTFKRCCIRRFKVNDAERGNYSQV